MTIEAFPGTQLETDIMTLVVRLEQMNREMDPADKYHWLWTDHIINCDIPRLRSYISPEVLRWIEDAL